ncbi:(Fe-S)-binding protein [Bacillota bacterium LX-D]|nr:(Fe-S)-binding protein [Bacillota bacterium LX-D]
MFLKEIRVVRTSPCLAAEEMIKVQAVLSVEIGELMPYLNAVLPKPNYDPKAQNLAFKKGEKLILLQKDKVAVTKLKNITHAYQELELLKGLINDTYERRDEITPIYEGRKRVGPLEIYKHLPRTNCKKCGEAACLAFATKLVSLEAEVNQCPDLLTEAYAEAKAKVLSLLGEE